MKQNTILEIYYDHKDDQIKIKWNNKIIEKESPILLEIKWKFIDEINKEIYC